MASIHRYRHHEGRASLRRSLARRRCKQRGRAFSRRKDAERLRVEQGCARQLGQLYDAPPGRFGEYLAAWLGRHARRVRPSTHEREAQSLRRFHVLSRYYVEEIPADRVEEIVMAGGMNAQAVKHRERLTTAEREAFDEAVERARMGTNESITIPAPASVSVPEQQETRRFQRVL